MPSPSKSQHGDRNSPVRGSTHAADHARGQVQVALDSLLGDDPQLAPPSPSGYEPFTANAQTHGGQSPEGRRVSFLPAKQEPVPVDATLPPRDRLSTDGAHPPPRKPSGMTVESGGYTPSAAGGRR